MTVVRSPVFVQWIVTGTSSGLLSARPSASTAGSGHVYTATDTGISYVSNGHDWFATELSSTGGAPSGAAGGDLTGTYPNPTIGSNKVTEGKIGLSDVTTDNVTSSAHGFAPKSPADATKFLTGAATPGYAQPKDSDLSTSDITTNDVSITKHGFAPKAPNDATKYLDGTGAYSVPAGSGGGGITKVPSTQISRAAAVGGDITLNHITTFAEVAAATGGPGTAGLDLTIAATVGDVLSVAGTLLFNNTSASAESFDIATWVSGAAVNWLGQSAGGANPGLAFQVSGVGGTLNFSIQYVVQAGDITGGNVVLRLHYRSGSATNRVLGRSVANGPLSLSVANLLH